LVVCLFVVALAYKAAVWASRLYRDRIEEQQARETDPLSISEDDLNLGEVLESEKHEHSIHVYNRSSKKIVVRSISANCDCLQISPNRDVELGPGGSIPVALVLRATISPKQERTDNGYRLTVPVEIQYSSASGKLVRKEWVLEATLAPVITLRQKAVDVGSYSILAALPEQVIEVEAEAFVKEVRCDVSPLWKTRIVKEGASERKTRFRITVSVAETPSPRKISDVLRIVPVGEGGVLLPGKEVRLLGEFLPDVVATPPTLHAGRPAVGATVTEWVRVHSLTNRPFSIERVETGEGLTVVAEPESSRSLYRVELHVARAGEQSATVTFHVRDEHGQKHKVEVVVRHDGQPKQP
jgi:hypothetical protein